MTRHWYLPWNTYLLFSDYFPYNMDANKPGLVIGGKLRKASRQLLDYLYLFYSTPVSCYRFLYVEFYVCRRRRPTAGQCILYPLPSDNCVTSSRHVLICSRWNRRLNLTRWPLIEGNIVIMPKSQICTIYKILFSNRRSKGGRCAVLDKHRVYCYNSIVFASLMDASRTGMNMSVFKPLRPRGT